jgi:hypothetical protein
VVRPSKPTGRGYKVMREGNKPSSQSSFIVQALTRR